MFDLIKVNWRRRSLCLCRPTDTSKTVIITAFVAVTRVVPRDKRWDNRKWQSERRSLLLSRASPVSCEISPEPNRGAFYLFICLFILIFTCFRILNVIFFLLSQFDNGGENCIPRQGAARKRFRRVACLRGRQEIMMLCVFTFYTQHTAFFFLLLHISIY